MSHYDGLAVIAADADGALPRSAAAALALVPLRLTSASRPHEIYTQRPHLCEIYRADRQMIDHILRGAAVPSPLIRQLSQYIYILRDLQFLHYTAHLTRTFVNCVTKNVCCVLTQLYKL